MTTQSPDTVQIAGADVPGDLAVRIIAAIRGLYPSVVEGKSDVDAVNAMVVEMLTSALVTWEGRQINVEAEEQIEQIRADAQSRSAQAQKAAKEAAAVLHKVPV